jgi:hypothetical protein
MRKVLKRWYVWLALLLLVGLAVSASMITGASRINQQNCDRIEEGMTTEQVTEILGPRTVGFLVSDLATPTWLWMDGPDVITITVDADGRVVTKAYNSPTAWHRLRWHANDLLFKLGIGRE